MTDSTMFDKLENDITNFLNSQKSADGSRADYQSIYKSFVGFIKDNHSCADFPTIKLFLSEQLSRFDIINSCAHYIEGDRPSKKSAAKKYLNAITFLYDNYFVPNGCSNDNLSNNSPFSGLYKEVMQKSKKDLADEKPQPALSEAEFQCVINYIKSNKKLSPKQAEVRLIWKLLLLYGFKLERLNSLLIGNFSIDERTLKIIIHDEKSITVKLPDQLALDLDEYIRNVHPTRKGSIFPGSDGNKIKPSFFEDDFKKLRASNNLSDKQNPFNTTGFAKYAIIQMIKADIDTYYIRNVSGMKSVIIEDCLKEYYSQLNESSGEQTMYDHYLDKKFSKIPTINLLTE